MPVVSKGVTSVVLNTGDVVSLLNEAASFSIPRCTFHPLDSEAEASGSLSTAWAVVNDVVPLGTRLTFTTSTVEGTPRREMSPVLVKQRDADRSPRPISVYPLHNAVDTVAVYDSEVEQVHLFWWWNAWSPDFSVPFEDLGNPSPPAAPPSSVDLLDLTLTNKLPAPPVEKYQEHSVPHFENPFYFKSVCPTGTPGDFDPRRPFWIAPIAEGFLYDPLADWPEGLTRGETKSTKGQRMPDTPGARLFQDMVRRGLVDFPTLAANEKPQTHFIVNVGATTASDWVMRGGIVAAQTHLDYASSLDIPEFEPVVTTGSFNELPDASGPIPSVCTEQDHQVILKVLKAHVDHRSIVNATRVLMYSTGRFVSGRFKTLPTTFRPPVEFGSSGPAWPSESQVGEPHNVLVIEHPAPVAHFSYSTNYRVLANTDKVLYPAMDYPEVTFYPVYDAQLKLSQTQRRQQEPQLDYLIGDPIEVNAKGEADENGVYDLLFQDAMDKGTL